MNAVPETDRSGVLRECYFRTYLPSARIRDALLYPEMSAYYDCGDSYCRSRSTHMNFLIAMVTRGLLYVHTAKAEYAVRPGEVALLDTRRPHIYFSVSGSAPSFYWMQFGGRPAEALVHELLMYNPAKPFSPPPEFAPRFEDLIKQLADGCVSELKASARIHELLSMLETVNSEQSVIERTASFMQRNYADAISIAELASLSNLSVSHYCALFKRRYNVSAHQYLIALRLTIAHNLISETELSVEEIADKVGYSSASAFISAFSARYKRTPVQLRRYLRGLNADDVLD